jgi:hypothetical protein
LRPAGTETRFLKASVARAEEAEREERFRDVPVAAPRMGVVKVGLVRVGEVARTIWFPEPGLIISYQ